jgi:hypothetical protein
MPDIKLGADGGELATPADATFGIDEPKPLSASAAQKQNAEGLVEPTSERPEAFDFASAVSRRPSEY